MVAVATIGGVVGLWLMVRPDRPVKLDGDLNIVVTRFWTVAEGAALSRDVEASIVRHIRRALSRSVPELDFQIAVPAGAAGPLSRDPSRATRDAAKVAAGMRAGIVLYGGLRFTGAETVATPRFYVASSTLRGAEELTDGYALGPPIRIRGDATANFASRADLRTQIGARTGALALVLIGLAYDRAGRWGRAIGFYERALGEIRWSRSGRILLLLLIGNAAGELGQHARAARAYAEALRLEPEYARAKYGLAELALHRASGECSPATTDAHALRRVSRAFSGVSRARVQPRLRRPRQTLEAKVVFGRARADFCLSQAGFDMRWEAAARGFHAVISRHRRNVADIQDEASESLAYLGFIELPARGAGDRRAAYRRAARRFSLAIKWSPRPDRQAHFYSMLGFTREQLGDTVAAATAYRRAALRAPTTRERRRNMDRAAVLERGAR
jgi:tetratricopeptide (TPR) repeat protein